jgi:hypothetical protein
MCSPRKVRGAGDKLWNAGRNDGEGAGRFYLPVSFRNSQTPEAQKDDPMTLSALYARLRASLGFNGFRDGGAVHKTEAQQTLDDLRFLKAQIAHISSTLPPKHLRTAEAKARVDLDKAQRAIRRWELDNQIKLAKAESEIAPLQRRNEGWF